MFGIALTRFYVETFNTNFRMPAVLVARELVKRKNFASKNPGVIVVFCVVGAIVILLISLWIHKKVAAKRKASNMI